MNFGLGENDNRNMFLSMMNNFNNFMRNMNNNNMMNMNNNMMNMNNNMMNNMNNPMFNNMNNPMFNNMNYPGLNMNMFNYMNNPMLNMNDPMFDINSPLRNSIESQKTERKEGLDIKCDVDRLLHSNHELENKNKDLQTILKFIPFTIIQEKPKNIRCVICLSDFEIGEKVSALPCCHTFHTKCLDDWIIRSLKCPVCKLGITLKSILGEDFVREHLKIIKEKEELKRKKEEEELKRKKEEEELKRKKEEILKWRKEKEELKRKKEEKKELKLKKEKEEELKKKKEKLERLKRQKEEELQNKKRVKKFK